MSWKKQFFKIKPSRGSKVDEQANPRTALNPKSRVVETERDNYTREDNSLKGLSIL